MVNIVTNDRCTDVSGCVDADFDERRRVVRVLPRKRSDPQIHQTSYSDQSVGSPRARRNGRTMQFTRERIRRWRRHDRSRRACSRQMSSAPSSKSRRQSPTRITKAPARL